MPLGQMKRLAGLAVVLLLGAACSAGGQQIASVPSQQALGDIPPVMLALYQQAGQRFGVPWNVIAGIGKVETDHGRSNLPGVHSGSNSAGAAGPMQFLRATFDVYKLTPDADIYSPADAVPAAANLLAKNGATRTDTLRQAIFAYNHADWYVDEVLKYAAQYGAIVGGPAGPGGLMMPVPGAIETQAFGCSVLGLEIRVPTSYCPSGRFHSGVDLGAGLGTPIRAAAAGVAHVPAFDSGYGNYVWIDHGNGVETLYAHMSEVGVQAGQTVGAGQQIGLVGSTGASTGPHLHFEVRMAVNGVETWEDASRYLPPGSVRGA